MYFLIKTLISAIIIASISELAKKSSSFAAILASLPLVSILAMIWLYWDTGDKIKVSELSRQIFWTVLPSLLFFITLPILLKSMRFGWAMISASMIMAGGYLGYWYFLGKLGLRI